jgi:hypothetical protein
MIKPVSSSGFEGSILRENANPTDQNAIVETP